jgi:glycosyltransferase involved in cell wall biosynthesis
MSLPFFSVVITTYNRRDFLEEAIKSVLNQSMIDFELIVVDDCSSDNTEALIETVKDHRLSYRRHANNSGVSTARNTGIHAARAQYICFLDDDDEYLPDFLEHTRNYIEQHPTVGFMWTGVNRVFYNGKKISTRDWRASKTDGDVILDKKMLFLNEFSASCGLTVSRECFDKAGLYRDGMSISEDLELVFRMVASGCDYHAIPRPLVQVNIHARASLSRNSALQKHIQSTLYLIANNSYLLEKFPEVWLHYHTVLLAHYYRAKEFDTARTLAKTILKKRFFHFRAWERILRFEFKKLKTFSSL